jgi:hypothetical protein
MPELGMYGSLETTLSPMEETKAELAARDEEAGGSKVRPPLSSNKLLLGTLRNPAEHPERASDFQTVVSR